MQRPLRGTAHVGGHHKCLGSAAYREAHVVGAVVAGLERRHGERPRVELEFLVDGLVVFLYPARYAVSAEYSRESLRRSPQPLVGMAAQKFVDIAHMVAVVVGEYDSAHRAGIVYAIVLKSL